MIKPTKFCKDCKHYGTPMNNRACAVAVEEFLEPDVITGELDIPERVNWSARSQRSNGERCGIEARWYEPKPPSLWRRIFARFAQ